MDMEMTPAFKHGSMNKRSECWPGKLLDVNLR